MQTQTSRPQYSMIDREEHEANIIKVRDLIKGLRIALMTTAHQSGMMHSRPMATQEAEFDGELWFFTGKDSEKVTDITLNPNVNLSYSDPGKGTYLSVSGTARVTYNRAKIEELWNPFIATWFPDGKDDPNLTLICVQADTAEYWEGTNNKIKSLLGFLKAAITKEPPEDLGKNETLTIR